MLCFLHIIICCCKKLGYHALDIITNISCLCKRGGICNSQRHLKEFGKHFYQISLTTSCRSDHQHIGFLDLNIIHGVRSNSLIMIIYTYGHYFLGIFLSDHIFIQRCLDLMRCRDIFKIDHRPRGFRFLLDLLRLISRILKTAKIDHAHIWHVKKIGIISIAHLCIHSIKALLHTVCTDMYIIGKVDHLPCLTLRSAA